MQRTTLMLGLGLALAGCGMWAPTWGMPDDRLPHYASSGSGHRAAALIARRQARADFRSDLRRVLRELDD